MTECLPPAALHACLPGPSPCHPREAELPKTPVFSYLFPTLCGFGLFFFFFFELSHGCALCSQT